MFSVFSTGAFAANLKGNVAVLGALDKVTGRVSSIEVDVGDTVKFLGLEIKVLACFYKPPEEAPDNIVFLNIKELILNEIDEKKKLKQHFNGWMFSSSPAVSALEHSTYDIWSISCKSVIKEEKKEIDNNLPVTPALSSSSSLSNASDSTVGTPKKATPDTN